MCRYKWQCHHAVSVFVYPGTFYVIGEFGNKHLYCSSMDAIEAVASPTFYCTFQGYRLYCIPYLPWPDLPIMLTFSVQIQAGAAHAWAYYVLVIGWSIHIFLVVFKLLCPILHMRSKKYSKWIHISFLLIGELTSNYIHTHTHTYVHTYIHANIYAHIYLLPTYLHTYILVYTRIVNALVHLHPPTTLAYIPYDLGMHGVSTRNDTE